MLCDAISYQTLKDIVVPLVAAFIGGFLTLAGVWLTIHREKKAAKDNKRASVKPWIYSLDAIEHYDHNSANTILLGCDTTVRTQLQFIIKNTDNGIAIIDRFETENNVYLSKAGKILDKNSVTHLLVNLGENETLEDMYLYVKDVYGNTYQYRAYQRSGSWSGNRIEEMGLISSKRKPKKKKAKKTEKKK